MEDGVAAGAGPHDGEKMIAEAAEQRQTAQRPVGQVEHTAARETASRCLEGRGREGYAQSANGHKLKAGCQLSSEVAGVVHDGALRDAADVDRGTVGTPEGKARTEAQEGCGDLRKAPSGHDSGDETAVGLEKAGKYGAPDRGFAGHVEGAEVAEDEVEVVGVIREQGPEVLDGEAADLDLAVEVVAGDTGAGLLDHAFGDVDCQDRRAVMGEPDGVAAGAAAEVEYAGEPLRLPPPR